mgnify:CR=1 FL=1
MAKKATNDEKIIAALDSIDRSVRTLQKYGAKYDGYIDEAAMHGNDARARQLIKQKVRVFALVDQLISIKSNIELGAFTSFALAELGKLPAAISACKGLLAESPNFEKLAKSITDVFGDISKSEERLSRLNSVLSSESVDNIESRLDSYAEEESDQFNAEYAAMIERIKGKVAPELVAKPCDVGATGDIDYAGIVADENKKK